MSNCSPPRARTPHTEPTTRARRRRRLAVALVPAGTLGPRIDGLRLACGDPTLGRVPPHLTLAHPVNVADDRIAAVLDAVRAAAAHASRLVLTIGPVELFDETPTAYLSVGGDLAGLARIRESLRRGPLAGAFDRTYVPHVTVARRLGRERLEAVRDALADFSAPWLADRLHVMAEEDDRSWTTLAEATLGRRDVVGQGGLALELQRSSLPDLDALAMTGALRTVTARRHGQVVGVAIGRVRGDEVVVDAVEVADGEDEQVTELLLDRLAAAD